MKIPHEPVKVKSQELLIAISGQCKKIEETGVLMIRGVAFHPETARLVIQSMESFVSHTRPTVTMTILGHEIFLNSNMEEMEFYIVVE